MKSRAASRLHFIAVMRTSMLCVATMLLTVACASKTKPGGGSGGVTALDAVDDQLAVEMNTPAQLDVLDNDDGVDDGATLAITTPAYGTASIDSSGTLTYTPGTDYLGADSLHYTVSNPDGTTSTAAVAVTVGCATCAIGVTITLTWNPNAPADMIEGYRLYMGSTDDTSTFTQIDDISVDRAGFDPAMPSSAYDGWTDLHLRIGDQACFALTAYNANGESGYSNVFCATVTHSPMHLGV